MIVMSGEKEAGRCDARCHNARTPGCSCVCGGKAHGSGLSAALALAAAQGAQLCADYITNNGLDGATAIVLHDAQGHCIECGRPTRDWTPHIGLKYAFEESWLRGKRVCPVSGHKLRCKLRPTVLCVGRPFVEEGGRVEQKPCTSEPTTTRPGWRLGDQSKGEGATVKFTYLFCASCARDWDEHEAEGQAEAAAS